MRVLLVFPDVESPYGKPRYPPLSLCYLGASLLKAGHEVRALDLRMYKNSQKEFQKNMEEFKPDVVGTTATSFSFKGATDIVNASKVFSEKIITIIGGPHITIVPEELLKHKSIDYGLIGDGEKLIVDIVSAIGSGKSFLDTPGLIYRKEGKIVCNPSVLPTDLDSLPFPAFELFQLEKYKAQGVLKLPIMTSRGCPYGCIYCCSHKIFGRKFRPRSPESVIAEVERDMKQFGSKTFTIIDDLFTFDEERVIKICSLILEKNLGISWSCDQGVRADRSSLKMFKKMKESSQIRAHTSIIR